MNKGGFGKDARDQAFAGIMGEIKQHIKKLEDAGKKGGASFGVGFGKGTEDSIEDIRKSKEELLEELESAKKTFEKSLTGFPQKMKDALSRFNFSDLARVTRNLERGFN